MKSDAHSKGLVNISEGGNESYVRKQNFINVKGNWDNYSVTNQVGLRYQLDN